MITNRALALEDYGLQVRPLFGPPRSWHLDEIEELLPRRARFRDGTTVSIPKHLDAAVRAALSDPGLAYTWADAASHVQSAMAGPHTPGRLARYLERQAETIGASDIHLEPTTNGYDIRMRLAGQLEAVGQIPSLQAPGVLAAFKLRAGCVPYRSDIAQEGRIGRDGVAADIRASFIPTALGNRVALRLFGKLHRLQALGFDPETRSALETSLGHRRGLVLIGGSSGAGKTTTLYACLAHLAEQRAGAHLSIEDPVEQRLRLADIAVDQIELEPNRGFDGAAALDAALRQDIDVLSVGEIRSAAEAQLAVRAAHTGRLVLAGIHAGSCDEARSRLIELGADPHLLDHSLRFVLHQGLGQTTCDCDSGCQRCAGLGRFQRVQASYAEYAR